MPWRVTRQGAKFCVVKIATGAVVACHDTQADAEGQRRALYANTDYGLQLAIQDLNLEAAQEDDVDLPGGSHNLRSYWTKGPGAAKIRWGTDGSFDRCVRQLGRYVRDPKGLCAEYHKVATGEWPRGGTVPSADQLEEFHGTHNQRDHDPHKGYHVVGGEVDPDDLLPGEAQRRARRDDNDNDKMTRREEIDRMIDLERKADSDEGLSNERERRELRRLRKLYGDLYDPDYDDQRVRDEDEDDDDFALKPTSAGKRKRTSTKEGDGRETYAAGDGDEPWNGVLSVEGIESGDGRLFALGSLDWERPPQPLMYQPANVGGHNASVLVGRIDKITRHGSRIRGEGVVFGSALAGEHGDGIRHMMETGGVSVDVDRVKDADVEMVYADDESGDGGNMFAKPETTIFHRGRVRGATLVAFPAFVEAKLAFTGETLIASGDADCGCEPADALVASVHTIEIPNLPRAEWFNEPTDVKLTGALTITDAGRVYGVVAPADTTHRNVKRRVPRSLDFSRFHKGETIVEGGGRVVTGVITADCGHAATQNYGTLDRRLEHYDNSCSVLANVRVGYARNGSIWAAGALNPGADPRQVAQALGCALSLDVQPHPDRPGVREFIAAHLVPVPGFPLARTQASVTYQDGVLAASSVPVVHVNEPTYVPDTFAVYHMAKRALAASIGMDYATRKRELALSIAEELHGTTHNEQDHDPHKGFHVPKDYPPAVKKLGKYQKSAMERNDRNRQSELEAKVARRESLTDAERAELRLLRKLYGDFRLDERNFAVSELAG